MGTWVYWVMVGMGVALVALAAGGVGWGRLRRLPGLARLLLAFVGLQAVGTGGRNLHWPVAVDLGLACASLVTAVMGWAAVRRRLRERRSPVTLPGSGE